MFVGALNKTRIGQPDKEAISLFASCTRPLPYDESIIPTRMYPVRATVDEENQKQFNALSTPVHQYIAVDTQSRTDWNAPDLRWMLKDLQAQSLVRMRVGAQVMLLTNLDVKDGLVNGSRGVVTSFVSTEEAKAQLTNQIRMRGGQGEDSTAHEELRTFSKGDDSLEYPKVLFETNSGKREVSFSTNGKQLTYRLLSRRICGHFSWDGICLYRESRSR